jgi:hypothetical protein
LVLGTQPSGFTYSLINNAANTSIDLRVISLPGDYNNNGTVDAADYVVWRRNVGTSSVMPNDPIGGTIGPAQYDQWRARFGQTAGSGSGDITNAAVPEPGSLMLLIVGLLTVRSPRRAAVS